MINKIANEQDMIMKFLSGVFRYIAFLIMGIAIIFLPLSLFANHAGGILFSQDVIVDLIQETIFDEDVLATLAEDVLKTSAIIEVNSEEPNPYLNFLGSMLEKLDHDLWVDLIQTITPTDLISGTFNTIIIGYYDWLDNDALLPDIVIDLRPWKSNTIQNAAPVVEIIFSVLPDCTAKQLGDYVLNLGLNIFQVSEVPSIPLCKPSEPYYSILVKKGISIVPAMVEKIPDQIDISNQFSESKDNLVIVKQTLLKVRFILQWSWIIVILLFLIALPMGARSISQLFKWIGCPIILAGGIIFIFMISLPLLSSWIIASLSITFLTEIPTAITFLFESVLGVLLTNFTMPLRNQGLILLFLGVSSLVIGYVVESLSKNRKSEPELSD